MSFDAQSSPASVHSMNPGFKEPPSPGGSLRGLGFDDSYGAGEMYDGAMEWAGVIPVDAAYSDYDYDADDASYSSGRTLATTITQYRYENGRRYHAFRDGAYYAPNDERMQDLDVILHHTYLLNNDDKLFIAPLDNPRKVLDIGAGTGLWTIDFADMFPDAEIIATDLSPNQATMAPPNVRFEIDDCCSEWVYPENDFDYIHIRGLNGCVDDWLKLYQQAFKHTTPGGYFEHIEFSVPIVKNDPNAERTRADEMYQSHWENVFLAGRMIGRSFEGDCNMTERLKEAGFVDIIEHVYKWPIGPWSSDDRLKEIGRWTQRFWLDGIDSWVLALFTRQLGWSAAHVQEWTDRMKQVVRDRNCHYLQMIRCVTARKPFPGEVVPSPVLAPAPPLSPAPTSVTPLTATRPMTAPASLQTTTPDS